MAEYRVAFAPAADRQLAKLPRRAREMVVAAILTLRTNPRPSGCVKLAGSDDVWRIRVHDYRVVYTVRDVVRVVTVVKIGHRKDVYR